MKKILIIRHAKSSWGEAGLPDFDRPLNERGKADAPAMGKRLLSKNTAIGLFISSPAKRAKKTCKLFCKEFHYKEEEIVYVDKLYLAPAETFFEVIKSLDDKYETVALFAHNPGVTDFANRLCNNVYVDDMPTCSIFAVESDIKSWKDFSEAVNTFLFFDHPKA